MKHRFLITAMLALSPALALGATCDRSPRVVDATDGIIAVYVYPEQQVLIAFPEDGLLDLHRERPENLKVMTTQVPNKLQFESEDPKYRGIIKVNGASGRTYTLELLSRFQCADTVVSIEDTPAAPAAPQSSAPTSSGPAPAPSGSSQTYGSKARQASLIEYLLKGDVPSGYRRWTAPGTAAEREVFRQGSVRFYLVEQFIGTRLVGTTLEVVNEGRTPTRVAFNQIDFMDPAVRKVMGEVHEITMLPSDGRLQPAPEYVSGSFGSPNRGLLFVVSERSSMRGFR